jgi:hypothetical protein
MCAHAAGRHKRFVLRGHTVLLTDADLDRLLSARPPCLLCNRPPSFAVVFVPRAQQLVGAPPGKLRLVRYSLCKRCLRKRGVAAAERHILAEAAALARVN